MAEWNRVVHAAEMVAQLLKEEFKDDPEWHGDHSLRFLLNLTLFDVLAVLNAPDSLTAADGSAAGRFKDFMLQADVFRGDFLAMCTSLSRIELDFVENHEPREYESGLSCLGCGKPILEGEPMWTVDVKYEMLDRGVISVMCSEIARVFCEACAARRDFSRIVVPVKQLRAFPILSSEEEN